MLYLWTVIILSKCCYNIESTPNEHIMFPSTLIPHDIYQTYQVPKACFIVVSVLSVLAHTMALHQKQVCKVGEPHPHKVMVQGFWHSISRELVLESCVDLGATKPDVSCYLVSRV